MSGFLGSPRLSPSKSHMMKGAKFGGGLGVFWAPKEDNTSVLMACWQGTLYYPG